jgi:hypothetical protein
MTTATIKALTPVLTGYSAEIVEREKPVSSIIESMNTEKTNDWPGPLLKATRAPTTTMTQP